MRKRKKMKRNKRTRKRSAQDSQESESVLKELLRLTDGFCAKHLNEDYRELCEDMVEAAYEEGLPLHSGKPASWASGIVHAVGWVNFLHDPSQSPHMTSTQVAEGFGVSQATMMAKSKIIRDELEIMPMDPEWCLPGLLADNPLVWMLSVNGFIMDVRAAPREVQEQAYRQGLIPYIPADMQELGRESGTGPRIIKLPCEQSETARPATSQQAKDNGPALFDGLNE